MTYRVVYSAAAKAQLLGIFDYIASQASYATARRFTDSIARYCAGLSSVPHRGTTRDDLRPGLRAIGYKGRVTIVFRIEQKTVTIAAIAYGGVDWESDLKAH